MEMLLTCHAGWGWDLDLQNALRSHQGWLQCSTREDQEDALHCCGRFCASRRRLGQSWKCETFQTAAVVLSRVVDREAGSTMVASQAKCSRIEQAISGLNPSHIPNPGINPSPYSTPSEGDLSISNFKLYLCRQLQHDQPTAFAVADSLSHTCLKIMSEISQAFMSMARKVSD